jgi:hypothetical protein
LASGQFAQANLYCDFPCRGGADQNFVIAILNQLPDP